MDKNKIFILGISFILLSIISLNLISAGLTEQQQMSIIVICNVKDSILATNITCLNNNCTTNITREIYPYGNPLARILVVTGKHIAIIYKNTVEFTTYLEFDGSIRIRDRASLLERAEKFLYYLKDLCTENTDDIKPIIYQIVENWTSENSEWGRHIFFEPYSRERETEILEELKKINKWCIKYKRVNNWLTIDGTLTGICIKTSNEKKSQIIKSIPIYFMLLLIILLAGFIIYLRKRKSN